MKRIVIGIGNNKGRAGKTPSTYYLGLHWARQGKRVTFIDLDGQANLTDMLHPGALARPTIADVLSDDCYIDEAITPICLPTGENIQLVAGCGELNEVEGKLSSGLGVMRLYSAINAAHPDSLGDLVLIDTPPHLGALTLGMIVAVGMMRGYIIMPTTPERHSVEGINNIQSQIQEAKTIPGCLPMVLGTIATQCRETRIHASWLTSLATNAYPPLLGVTPLRGGETADYDLRRCYGVIADRIWTMIGDHDE